jgi:hypothetical protein
VVLTLQPAAANPDLSIHHTTSSAAHCCRYLHCCCQVIGACVENTPAGTFQHTYNLHLHLLILLCCSCLPHCCCCCRQMIGTCVENTPAGTFQRTEFNLTLLIFLWRCLCLLHCCHCGQVSTACVDNTSAPAPSSAQTCYICCC